MPEKQAIPHRYLGLDVHKHYLVAVGVTPDKEVIYGPKRLALSQLTAWRNKELRKDDAVVLEMSTNSYELHDLLVDHVHSVTLVHPPHVKVITQAQVKTDRKAAHALAVLHAAGLLKGVWVPDPAGRDLRALVAQRAKLVNLATQAKNRLHAVLHRYQLGLPPSGGLFTPQNRPWWLDLPLSELAQVRLQTDLDTLDFAQDQIKRLQEALTAAAGADDRIPLLIQLPGIGLLSAITLLAAIGPIERFEEAAHLVGYAGLGGRVHDSGHLLRRGPITKAGRRDIRATMVEAAHTAVRVHNHWRDQFRRLQPRLGTGKAIVAIARKLLVAVWHVLSKQTADRFAQPAQVARFLLQYAYQLGKPHRPQGQSPAAYVRTQLDRLGLGSELTCTYHGKRAIPLPPSSLALVAA